MAEECVESSGSLVLIITVASIAISIALGILLRALYKARKQAKQHSIGLDAKVGSAIDTTNRLHATAAYVSAQQFVTLGSLQPYEKLRNRGVLTYRDTYRDSSSLLSTLSSSLISGLATASLMRWVYSSR